MTFDPENLIGRRKMEAMALISAANLRCRVIKEDGNAYVMPPDYDCRRVLLEIEAGMVTTAIFG